MIGYLPAVYGCRCPVRKEMDQKAVCCWFETGHGLGMKSRYSPSGSPFSLTRMRRFRMPAGSIAFFGPPLKQINHIHLLRLGGRRSHGYYVHEGCWEEWPLQQSAACRSRIPCWFFLCLCCFCLLCFWFLSLALLFF